MNRHQITPQHIVLLCCAIAKFTNITNDHNPHTCLLCKDFACSTHRSWIGIIGVINE
ncbi:Uncharacterised protein [Mycobacteroides abscessus subsp. abscessus]|nr:Uncharacterised protein [Mycobacteroides abscessus subsp. abscessus]